MGVPVTVVSFFEAMLCEFIFQRFKIPHASFKAWGKPPESCRSTAKTEEAGWLCSLKLTLA
jgi:hypothetical protein